MAAGRRSSLGKKRINLALQGGGAHGAFTWGVLDRLLQEDDLEIAAISGTSAGALNGAALKAGMVTGGPQAARENLDWLWEQVGALTDPGIAAWLSMMAPSASVSSKMIESAMPFSMLDATTRMFSPYVYGPFYQNPVRRLAERFDYEKVCGELGPDFYVGATNVRTGQIRMFTGREISTEVLMASACLPNMYQAVEFEDPKTKTIEAFWDGGYTGNPALYPLFEPQYPNDIVVVNINPLIRNSVPTTPQEIQNRINEISFNSSLLRELRAIRFVHRLLADGRLPKDAMKDVFVHMIADDDLMNDLSSATKMSPNPVILQQLKQAGQRAAAKFLEDHKPSLNVAGTVNLEDMLG